MSINVNLGGDRVGSGNKMNVHLKGFERSSHDLGRVWRSTMAPGVLVPFFQEYALNGDKWEIDLDTIVRTLPTESPLFGSFKFQMDVFQIPIRLYVNSLKNNKLDVGMKMQEIALPQMRIWGKNLDENLSEPISTQQINQSSLVAYLGTRGLGTLLADDGSKYGYVFREINALGALSYYDIFKNYYANKQEDKAYVIEKMFGYETRIGELSKSAPYTYEGFFTKKSSNDEWHFVEYDTTRENLGDGQRLFKIEYYNEFNKELTGENVKFRINGGIPKRVIDQGSYIRSGLYPGNTYGWIEFQLDEIDYTEIEFFTSEESNETQLSAFDLSNIDDIIEYASRNDNVLYVEGTTQLPIKGILKRDIASGHGSNIGSMNGLLVKTYQSDIFNNWINTEWIDGDNGINAITSVDTSSGSFTMDTLNLAQKVYDMLNRIAVSGGTYEDWQEAVWGEKVVRQAQTPIYLGGASTEIVFNEVVSNSKAEGEPLGTLAGKGTTTGNLKGGKIYVKINEPSIIMGICSITPRVDYSQGNKWFTMLKNMDNFHKPSLDGIGFQDLITSQMAFWEWVSQEDGDGEITDRLKSAGKQPAWLNYMTSYNECYGEFADENKQMYMTLNRRYDWTTENLPDGKMVSKIKDLTTYIDPKKFNYAFAYANRDAQNFWVQIGMDVTARRKMSAKIIPNL